MGSLASIVRHCIWALLWCVGHFAVLGFASRLQPFDYNPAVFVLFPVLVYAILWMRTGLVGLCCMVLHYGTVLFAGFWHFCCLGSGLALFASFLPILGAIFARYQFKSPVTPAS